MVISILTIEKKTLFNGVLRVGFFQIGPTTQKVDFKYEWGGGTVINSVSIHYAVTPGPGCLITPNRDFDLKLNGVGIAHEGWVFTSDTRNKTVTVSINNGANNLLITVDRVGACHVDFSIFIELVVDYTGPPPKFGTGMPDITTIALILGGIGIVGATAALVVREVRRPKA